MTDKLIDRSETEDFPLGLTCAEEPAEVDMDPDRLLRAVSAIERERNDRGGPVRAASLTVIRHGRVVVTRTWGEPSGRPFLIASLTKPITGLAALMLVQDGLLYLDAAVARFLPEFGERGKETITVRQLLSHTSGLPDMLPDNLELRAAHAPLEAYYRRLLEIEPLFVPGTQVSYQSMGFLVLAQLVERLTGVPLPQYLEERLFTPLGLTCTSLGTGSGSHIGGDHGAGDHGSADHRAGDHGAGESDSERGAVELGVPVQLPDDQEGTDWNWNSPYWRTLGAPWGGLLSTSMDLAALIDAVGSGRSASLGLIAGPTLQTLSGNQTKGLHYYAGSPAYGARHSSTTNMADSGIAPAWGLGWRLNAYAKPYSRLFGDLASPRAFGHTGATGTAFWYDPCSDVALCLLTTWPPAVKAGIAARVANCVLSSVLR